MPRAARTDAPGQVHHLLNRAVGGAVLFHGDEDYLRFVEVLREAREASGIRLCTWCVMPSHWHMVVWPDEAGQVGVFATRLAHLHAVRHRFAHKTVGHGPIYQGRYKSFLVQNDTHFLTLARYVERNPVRAGLAVTAGAWPWSAAADKPLVKRDTWPVPRPRNWKSFLAQAEPAAELERLRVSVARGRPFGSDAWVAQAVDRLKLHATVRPRGRPRRVEG